MIRGILWVLGLGLVGCGSLGGDEQAGTLMVRAGGLVKLERGFPGQRYRVENQGPGHVTVKDIGRPQNPDFRLYPGHIVEMRGPMDLLFRGEGGQDAMIEYRVRR